MKCYERGARTLKAAAPSVVWVLIAAISSGPALAETSTEGLPAPTASAPVADAVFPSAIDPKYAKETPAKARMHTCVDRYNANKASNANGGLKWIERGGGYYSQCNKRLGGVSPSTAPPREVGGTSKDGEGDDGVSV